YVLSPFLHEEISTNAHNVAIVPGDGAVVSGDGIEVASIDHITFEPGEEKLITALGPTLTFRELHGPLSIKNKEGRFFIKEGLWGKTVWGGIALVTLVSLLFF